MRTLRIITEHNRILFAYGGFLSGPYSDSDLFLFTAKGYLSCVYICRIYAGYDVGEHSYDI